MEASGAAKTAAAATTTTTTTTSTATSNTIAVVVGTVAGVYVTFVDGSSGESATGSWSRLGGCDDSLPLVYTMNLSYEQSRDTIVAATMGRGIYTLPNATSLLEEAAAKAMMR